jgi:chitin disaccharide deacetylase
VRPTRDRAACRLVLHADDFGLNADVTRGIIGGFSAGLLTSTALMANAPSARLAIDLWQRLEHSRQAGTLPSLDRRRWLADPDCPFDLGVHLNLTQGRPLTGTFPTRLLDERGMFLPPGRLYPRLLRHGRSYAAAIETELAAQVGFVESSGLRVSHLNGHQYVEMMPVIADIVPRLARRLAIGYVRAAIEPRHWLTSLRARADRGRHLPGVRLTAWSLSFVKQLHARRLAANLAAAGVARPDAFFGASHAGRVDLRLVNHYLRAAGNAALIEIALHPGVAPAIEGSADGPWRDPLARLRPGELELLRSEPLAASLMAWGAKLARLATAVGPTSATALLDAARPPKPAFDAMTEPLGRS